MATKEELIELSGQVINGMLSADDSVLSKLIDRSIHQQAAKTAVHIAADMLEEINKIAN